MCYFILRMENIICFNTNKWLNDTILKYKNGICFYKFMTEKYTSGFENNKLVKEGLMESIKFNSVPYVSIAKQCKCDKCEFLMELYSKILFEYNEEFINCIFKYVGNIPELQSVHDNMTSLKKAQRYKDRNIGKYNEKKLDFVNAVIDLLNSKNDNVKDLEEQLRDLLIY